MAQCSRRQWLLAPVLGLMLALGAAPVGAAPASAASTAERAAGKFKVNLAASAKTAEVGTRVRVKGTVAPARGASRVWIQLRSGKSWKVLAKRNVKAGKFSYGLRVSAPGASQYRAFVPATSKRKAGVSQAVRVTGYRWRYMSEMNWFEDGDWEKGPAVINGTNYPKSVWADNNFWGDMEVNLNGKCTTLKGVAGITNESDSGSHGSLSIRSDGNEIYSDTFTLTTTASLSLRIDDVLRLTLNMETLTGSTFPYVGIGNARVYCRS